MRTKDNFINPSFGVGRTWVSIYAVLYFCVMTCDAMSLTKQRLTPFKIKDLERGTYFKGNFMLYKEHAKCISDSHIPRDHHQYIMFTHSVPKTIFICSTTWATTCCCVCRKIGAQHGSSDNSESLNEATRKE